MPLIDQNGKKLRIDRPPQYDVKIVASRREIVWNDNHDTGNDDRNQDIKAGENKNPGVIDNINPETDDKSARIEPITKNKTKRRKVINNHNRRPPVNTKNFQGKLLKSKSDDEISRRKTSTSSFRILSSKSNDSNNSKGQGKQSELRVVDFRNPVELDRAVAEDMGGVSSRNMDLMIMEMRKLDRDRDRVLIPNTVKTTLEKFHIPVQPAAREVLLENFQDKTNFIGMVNYEELVRYLEEKRLQGEKVRGVRTDSFILYETEHGKARYKRNRHECILYCTMLIRLQSFS